LPKTPPERGEKVDIICPYSPSPLYPPKNQWGKNAVKKFKGKKYRIIKNIGKKVKSSGEIPGPKNSTLSGNGIPIFTPIKEYIFRNIPDVVDIRTPI